MRGQLKVVAAAGSLAAYVDARPSVATGDPACAPIWRGVGP